MNRSLQSFDGGNLQDAAISEKCNWFKMGVRGPWNVAMNNVVMEHGRSSECSPPWAGTGPGWKCIPTVEMLLARDCFLLIFFETNTSMQIKMPISYIYETVPLHKPHQKFHNRVNAKTLAVSVFTVSFFLYSQPTASFTATSACFLFNLGWMNVITARMQILRDHICLHIINGLKSLKIVFKSKFRKISVVH